MGWGFLFSPGLPRAPEAEGRLTEWEQVVGALPRANPGVYVCVWRGGLVTGALKMCL